MADGLMSQLKVRKGSLKVTFINLRTGRKETATVSHHEQASFWRRQKIGQISIIEATRKRKK